MTLRAKLVLAVVALVAVLGVVISLVSALFLQRYLVGRLDDQLDFAASRGQAVAFEAIGAPGGVSAKALLSEVVNARGLSAGTYAALITSDGHLYSVYLSTDPSATLQSTSTDVSARMSALPTDGTATTINLGGTLGEYRVVAVKMPGTTSADSSDPTSAELVIGLPLADVNATTGQLLTIILAVTVGGIAAAAGVGLLIVVLALRPLDRVAATATAVSKMRLDKGEVAIAVRVPENDTDPHTEVGRLGHAFNRMLGHVASALSARQASENKVRQFVADASHELRTPLASIRGYAELTRRLPEPLPDDAVHALGRIESEAERMTGLVEDLLLLARLDEGRELDRDPVDLSRLVIDAVSDAHAAGREQKWSVDIPPYPVTVIGDEPRLHEVIANLLTNARVHTPEGTSVETQLRGADGKAVITVTDDGPGIPDDLQPVLFERFARGDSSRSRHTGSTGLGLAIVRAVVRAQGGEVEVQSEPGRTRFTVTLPLAEPVADSETDAESETMADAEPEATVDAESESMADAESEATVDAESESTVDAESETTEGPVAESAEGEVDGSESADPLADDESRADEVGRILSD
jgi:two-component system OmpR family sensor kinase